jgi:hypothetical protein
MTWLRDPHVALPQLHPAAKLMGTFCRQIQNGGGLPAYGSVSFSALNISEIVECGDLSYNIV